VRLNCVAFVSRRVRAVGTKELSGGEDDDEDDGSVLESSAHALILFSKFRKALSVTSPRGAL